MNTSQMAEEQRQKRREYARLWAAEWRKANPERTLEISRADFDKNKEKIRERARLRRKNDPEMVRAEDRAWYAKNRKRKLAQLSAARKAKTPAMQSAVERTKKWRAANPDKVRANKRRAYARTRGTNCDAVIGRRLRTRISQALRQQSGLKAKRTIELLGCSLNDFRIYIESKFEIGMTWGNWGKGKGRTVWHIDHIIPCALFDLKRPDHQKRCFHFSNLQPLWAYDNTLKGAKMPDGVLFIK